MNVNWVGGFGGRASLRGNSCKGRTPDKRATRTTTRCCRYYYSEHGRRGPALRRPAPLPDRDIHGRGRASRRVRDDGFVSIGATGARARSRPTRDVEPVSPYAASIPRREVIPQHPQHSVRAMTHDFPSEICGWNAHPEYEIHLITKTHGSFIAGDHIGTFGPGHVSLIGPNLPHDWVSDLEPGQVAVDRDAVIQFTDGWIRQCMQLLPELQELDGVLRHSTRGLVFSGATAWRAADQIMSVVGTRGPERVGHLFKLLGLMAQRPRRRVGDGGQRVDGPPRRRRRPQRRRGRARTTSSPTSPATSGSPRRPGWPTCPSRPSPSTSSAPPASPSATWSRSCAWPTPAGCSTPPTTPSPGWPRSAATTTWPTSTASSWPRWAARPSAYRRMESSLKPPNEVLSLGLKAARAGEPTPRVG